MYKLLIILILLASCAQLPNSPQVIPGMVAVQTSTPESQTYAAWDTCYSDMVYVRIGGVLIDSARPGEVLSSSYSVGDELSIRYSRITREEWKNTTLHIIRGVDAVHTISRVQDTVVVCNYLVKIVDMWMR